MSPLEGDERFLADQLIAYGKGTKGIAKAFEAHPNGEQLEAAFRDMLEVFELDTMSLDVRQQILSEQMCECVTMAYIMLQPWQRWWFTQKSTLEELDAKTLRQIADRIKMYAMEIEAKEAQNDERE